MLSLDSASHSTIGSSDLLFLYKPDMPCPVLPSKISELSSAAVQIFWNSKNVVVLMLDLGQGARISENLPQYVRAAIRVENLNREIQKQLPIVPGTRSLYAVFKDICGAWRCAIPFNQIQNSKWPRNQTTLSCTLEFLKSECSDAINSPLIRFH